MNEILANIQDYYDFVIPMGVGPNYDERQLGQENKSFMMINSIQTANLFIRKVQNENLQKQQESKENI